MPALNSSPRRRGRGGLAAVTAAWPDTPLVNLGGGLPVAYDRAVPAIQAYAAAVDTAVAEHFPGRPPALVIEPGRFLVADAGVLHTCVVRVSRRDDGNRWVYLDVGRYGGLAETENEAIRYRITRPRNGVLPLGTTNNFARSLGLPLHLPAALRILTEGKVADVDLGHVAGRHFANLTSLGLSVQVAEHVPHLLKRVLGRAALSADRAGAAAPPSAVYRPTPRHRRHRQ